MDSRAPLLLGLDSLLNFSAANDAEVRTLPRAFGRQGLHCCCCAALKLHQMHGSGAHPVGVQSISCLLLHEAREQVCALSLAKAAVCAKVKVWPGPTAALPCMDATCGCAGGAHRAGLLAPRPGRDPRQQRRLPHGRGAGPGLRRRPGSPDRAHDPAARGAPPADAPCMHLLEAALRLCPWLLTLLKLGAAPSRLRWGRVC